MVHQGREGKRGRGKEGVKMGAENPIRRKEGREGGSMYRRVDGVSPEIAAFPEGDELV